MYLGQMTGEVKLGGYTLNGFHGVDIKKSIHQIVQTCKLVLPASVLMRNNDKMERVKLADKIKEGDAVSVAFGYDYKNKTEFTGYIKSIDRKIPVEVECEDAMYLFRKTNIKKTFNADIKQVLSNICDEVKKAHGLQLKLYSKIPAIQVQNFIVSDKTALWALQQLIDWYPMLSIRLVNDTLYCGLVYSTEDVSAKVNYAISGGNNNTVSTDELKYNTEIKTAKVVWEITKEDGKVEKKQFGDSNGEIVINKKIAGKVSDDVLKKMAENEMTQQTYIGFKGSFTTFLMPCCEPGMIANIDDPQFGRKGNYYIGTVTTTFDTTGGGRRKLEIDIKLK